MFLDFEETALHGMAKSWKQHKFLFDFGSIEKLYSILKILGELVDGNILIDSIIQMNLEIPKFRKELTLMLNTILLGNQVHAST